MCKYRVMNIYQLIISAPKHILYYMGLITNLVSTVFISATLSTVLNVHLLCIEKIHYHLFKSSKWNKTKGNFKYLPVCSLFNFFHQHDDLSALKVKVLFFKTKLFCIRNKRVRLSAEQSRLRISNQRLWGSFWPESVKLMELSLAKNLIGPGPGR